jgi:hypothetical protein
MTVAKTKKTKPQPAEFGYKANPTDKSILERLFFIKSLLEFSNSRDDVYLNFYQGFRNPYLYECEGKELPPTSTRQAWVPFAIAFVPTNPSPSPATTLAKQFKLGSLRNFQHVRVLLEFGPQEIRVRASATKTVEMMRLPYDLDIVKQKLLEWKGPPRPPLPGLPQKRVLKVREFLAYETWAKVLAGNSHRIQLAMGNTSLRGDVISWTLVLDDKWNPFHAVMVIFRSDAIIIMDRFGHNELKRIDYSHPTDTLEAFLRDYLGLTIPEETPEHLPPLPPGFDELEM